jgi:hypothetical protein
VDKDKHTLEWKRCRTCKKVKSIKEYHVSERNDGTSALSGDCKECKPPVPRAGRLWRRKQQSPNGEAIETGDRERSPTVTKPEAEEVHQMMNAPKGLTYEKIIKGQERLIARLSREISAIKQKRGGRQRRQTNPVAPAVDSAPSVHAGSDMPPRQEVIDELLTPQEVSAEYGISEANLATWRTRGGGPRFFRPRPRVIRYKRSSIIEWLGDEVSSTGEAKARSTPRKDSTNKEHGVSDG